VRAFLADLRKAGQRPGTLRLRYSALRLFGKWLASEGELDADPLLSMSPPKLDRPMVHAVADADVTALLRACEGKTFADKRDTALVRLLVLQADYDAACADTAADQGEEIVDCGGWVELACATVSLAAPDISAEAKREFLRMNGIERSWQSIS
jgi:hypothetical protein